MTALVQAVAVIGLLVVVATVVGRGVLVWCPGDDRPLTEAAVVGAASLVLWLVALAVVVPAGSPAAVGATAAAVAVLLGVGGRVRPGRLRPSRDELLGFAGVVAVAVAVTAPTLLVVAGAGSTAVVHLSGNHDAFFFTAIPEWLMGHRAVGGPGLGAGGSPDGIPLHASVWDHYQATHTRIGSEVLTAFTTRATAAETLNTWLPVTLAFQAFVVLGAQRLAAELWRPGRRATLAGAVVGTAAHTIGAVVDQHTPTLLATAFALVLVAEVHRATSRPARAWSPLVVAVLASGIAATYGELFALLALPLGLLVVVRAVRRRRFDVRPWAAVAAWCVALAALPWWRAVQGATATPAPAGYASHVAAGRGVLTALHAATLGPAAASAGWRDVGGAERALVVAFAVALVTGSVLVAWRGRARAWWAGLAVVSVAGWWWFGRWDHSGYPQERFVQWALPLLALGAVLGWATLVDPAAAGGPDPERGRSRGRAGGNRRLGGDPHVPLLAIALVAAVAVAAPGVVAGARLDDAPTRRVDASFTDPAAWVAERDPSGSDTLVWAEDYTNNLWSPFVLRTAPRSGYVSIYEDYYDVRSFGRMSGRRWLLLDRLALGRATLPPGAVAAANGRFSLVDLDQGPVELVVPPLWRGRWSDGDRTVRVSFESGAVRCRADDGEPLPCS